MTFLKLDLTNPSEAYIENWKQTELPKIVAELNDETVILGSDSLEEVNGVLEKKDLPESLRPIVQHLQSVLSDLKEYYGVPMREHPKTGEESNCAAPIVTGDNHTTRPLCLLTQADGRVINRYDLPSNWVMTQDKGLQFSPVCARPVADLGNM